MVPGAVDRSSRDCRIVTLFVPRVWALFVSESARDGLELFFIVTFRDCIVLACCVVLDFGSTSGFMDTFS